MINRLIYLTVLLSLFLSNALASFDVKAKTAILQDYLSGKILYEKEPRRPREMRSGSASARSCFWTPRHTPPWTHQSPWPPGGGRTVFAAW